MQAMKDERQVTQEWRLHNPWPAALWKGQDLPGAGNTKLRAVQGTVGAELTLYFPYVEYGKTTAADMCKLNFPQKHASALQNWECKSGVV